MSDADRAAPAPLRDDHVTDAGGAFVRPPSRFRNWVTADGRPGPQGQGGFRAEPGRYHLYAALICPWAQRTLILRQLKQLQDVVSVSIVLPQRGPQGWEFGAMRGCSPDVVNGERYLRDVYLRAEPHYDGRVTVPVLWDRERATIVNNESADIVRMLNSAFDAYTPVATDFYPPALRAGIDAVNDMVYEQLNNGVYRAGLARSQAAYEQAYDAVFSALDGLEARLASQRYLVGTTITEADWRLFPTLVRFDAVYHTLFKCNARRLVDYPNLWAYTRELYQWPGIAATVDLEHIKLGYWRTGERNPNGIVPKGPELDLCRAHGRDRLPAGDTADPRSS